MVYSRTPDSGISSVSTLPFRESLPDPIGPEPFPPGPGGS